MLVCKRLPATFASDANVSRFVDANEVHSCVFLNRRDRLTATCRGCEADQLRRAPPNEFRESGVAIGGLDYSRPRFASRGFRLRQLSRLDGELQMRLPDQFNMVPRF